MGVAPLIVTGWRRNGQLRVGCLWPACLQISDFPAGALGSVCPCPACGQLLRLNTFLMENVPTWDRIRERSASGGELSEEDRAILDSLEAGLDHHAAFLREYPETVLQELGNELRFAPGAAGEWAQDTTGVFQLLHPGAWATVGRAMRMVLAGHTRAVIAVALSGDGRHVLSGSSDQTLRWWNLHSGQSQVLAGHTGGVNAGALSPDGRWAVSGGGHQVLLWDLHTERLC